MRWWVAAMLRRSVGRVLQGLAAIAGCHAGRHIYTHTHDRTSTVSRVDGLEVAPVLPGGRREGVSDVVRSAWWGAVSRGAGMGAWQGGACTRDLGPRNSYLGVLKCAKVRIEARAAGAHG